MSETAYLLLLFGLKADDEMEQPRREGEVGGEGELGSRNNYGGAIGPTPDQRVDAMLSHDLSKVIAISVFKKWMLLLLLLLSP